MPFVAVAGYLVSVIIYYSSSSCSSTLPLNVFVRIPRFKKEGCVHVQLPRAESLETASGKQELQLRQQHQAVAPQRRLLVSKSCSSDSSASYRYASRTLGTFVTLMSLPNGPGNLQFSPIHFDFVEDSNPDILTLFAQSSAWSVALNLQTCDATAYSSIKGSFVMWNCNGSSVDNETKRPWSKNCWKGFLVYSKNSALLLRGDIAIGICAR